MKIKNSNYRLLVIAVISLIITACEKEKIEDPAVKEVLQGFSAYNTIPVGEGTVVVSDGKLLGESYKPASFFPRLNALSGSDVSVTASVDNSASLLQIYDSLYKTSSQLFDRGVFSVRNDGKSVIAQGRYQSPDSIQVVPADASSFEPGAYRFVVPVRVQSAPSNLLASSLMFVKYNVTVTTAFIMTASTGRNNIVQTVFQSFPFTASPMILIALDKAIVGEMKFGIEGVSTPELADAYNAKYKTNYKPFPAGAYSFSSDSVGIPANAIISSPATASIFRPDPTKFPSGSTYVLALRIKDKKQVGMTPDEILNSNKVLFAIITSLP